MSTILTTLPLTDDERHALHRLDLLIDELRKVNPEMPIQQAKTLVTVALEQGMTVTDIAQRAGLALASASRHVEALGPERPSRRTGLGLLADDYDVVNRRRKIITLTHAGARVVKSLIHYMQPRK